MNCAACQRPFAAIDRIVMVREELPQKPFPALPVRLPMHNDCANRHTERRGAKVVAVAHGLDRGWGYFPFYPTRFEAA